MNNPELVLQVNKELALQLPEKISMDELQQRLSSFINDLIQNNFEQLVSLLYRIDVSEAKIKLLLQTPTGENTSDMIARLIIERQLQKIKNRKLFSKRDTNFNEEERW